MKRFLLIFIVIIIFLTSFQKTINFWTIQLKPYYTGFMNKIINDYYEETGVKINWLDVEFNTYIQRYYTFRGTSMQPDVLNINTNMLIDLYLKLDYDTYNSGHKSADFSSVNIEQ